MKKLISYTTAFAILLLGCSGAVSHEDPQYDAGGSSSSESNSDNSSVTFASGTTNSSSESHSTSSSVEVDAGHDAGVDSWVAPITPGSVGTGGLCMVSADCAVGGCDYTGHCINAVSCTLHHGGDTCGAGEDTDLGPNATPSLGEESCCTSIPIAGTNYTVDKYLVTAGRMRAFVNTFNGDLRSFTASIPASNQYWNPNWNAYIPSTLDEVDAQMGPYPAPLSPDPYNPSNDAEDAVDGIPLGEIGQWRYGCQMGNPLAAGGAPDGARTWWSSGMLPSDQAPMVYPQDYLDDKLLNCVDAYMLTAFCIWDGGHLATQEELAAAWGAGEFPWSWISPNVQINQTCLTEDMFGNCTDTSFQEPMGVDANGLDMSHYIAHEFGGLNFQFINPFTYSYDPYNLFADNSINIPAPGRFPLGNSQAGVSDLVGATYTITAIQEPTTSIYPPPSVANSEHIGTMAGQGSFEIHPVNGGSGTEQMDANFRPAWWAYWAGGGRCAR